MDLELKHRPDLGLLYARLSGAVSLAEAKRTFLQILQGIEQHRVGKVLVDALAVTGVPTTMERFHYGEFVAEGVFETCSRAKLNTPRFAYVLVEPLLDRERLGETVAVNRGVAARTFKNIQDALEWLGIEPAGI